ncbi:M15 family metallopeptidase [Syntrophomonas curvata]
MKAGNRYRKSRQYKSIIIFVFFISALSLALHFLPSKEKVVRNADFKATAQDMIALDEHIPEIMVDLRYATTDNFTRTKIYDDDTAYLRRGTAEKLKAAQADFTASGYGIKVWDAYRPPTAQFKLWNKCPDARFVINPHQGYSYHSRGVAVDITLVDKEGRELPMPTGFDDFTAKADRDYGDIDEERARNARLLEQIMLKHGFQSIHYEWWHFIDSDKDRYSVIDPAKTPYRK